MDIIQKIFFLVGKKLKSKIFFLFFILSLITLTELLSLGLIIPLIKALIENNQNFSLFEYLKNFQFINSENLISFVFVLILIVFFLKFVFFTVFTFIKAKILTNIRTTLGINFFKSYLEKDLLFFLRKNTAQLLRNCDQEIVILARCINAILTLLLETLVLISIIVIVFYVQPLISLIPFLLILFFSIIYFFLSKNYLKNIGSERFELQATKIQFLMQGFGSIREIKINQNINFYLSSFQNTLKRLMQIIKIKIIFTEIIRPTLEFLVIVCITVNTFILRSIGYTWSEVLSVIIVYGVVAVRLLPAFSKINQNLQVLVFNNAPVTKLHNELKSIKNYQTKNEENETIEFKQNILLKDISFSFKDKNPIFNKLNIKINKGDIIGIAGQSGVGKSTLLEIISGLLSPEEGSVSIDDNIKNLNNKNWFKKISYASEKSYFIDDTLLVNITFENNNSDIDFDHLKKVLKITKLLSDDGNYEIDLKQKMGEVGKNLSSGQKQRISLSRALYKKTEILILDESTNAVDELTQEKIMNSIFSYSKTNKVTVLVVSHDTKVLNKCDNLCTLENKIVTQTK